MLPELIESTAFAGPLTVLRALLEIALLGYLLYQLVRAIRGTRTVPVLFGVLLLGAGYLLANRLGLRTISWLYGIVAPYAVIALIVVFQAEIRTALRDMALQFAPRSRAAERLKLGYEEIVFAIAQLSAGRVGALIVIERETGLRTFIQSGVALEARLSSDLLLSIFQRNAPLHDGGVIVERDRIAAASCFLPLTTNPGLASSLGTRHRAAIGVTEESDAVALVVSETDGRISMAFRGEIERDISIDRLRLRMIQRLGPVVAPPQGIRDDPTPAPDSAPTPSGDEDREPARSETVSKVS